MQIYFIDIQDKFLLDDAETSVNLLIELHIENFNFSFQLLGFSNSEQQEVLLKNSIYATDLPKKSYLKIYNHYTKIAHNYLEYLKNSITTKESLKEFIYRLNNPQFIFHAKLLKVFTLEDLEYISEKYFRCYPILNLENFDGFLPIEINGWYINGTEVDTNLDDNNVPFISDENGEILSPMELLEVLK